MKINVENKTKEKIYFVITTNDKVLYADEIKNETNTEFETNIVIRKEQLFDLKIGE